jgi:hypothetical protein
MAANVNVNIREEPVDLYDVPETVIDDLGQPSQAATLIKSSILAKVDSLQARYREMLEVRQQWPLATHRVTLGWQGTNIPSTTRNPYRQITPDMKIICQMDGKVLNIVAAINVERRNERWLLICQEHFGATT